ncbi:MAG: hypothetical protein AB7P37_14805 [Ramlibacter sp.]
MSLSGREYVNHAVGLEKQFNTSKLGLYFSVLALVLNAAGRTRYRRGLHPHGAGRAQPHGRPTLRADGQKAGTPTLARLLR